MAILALPSRPIGPCGRCTNCRYAPSTWTCAMRKGPDPSARMVSSIRPGVSLTLSTFTCSTGGAEAVSRSSGRVKSRTARRPASTSSGSTSQGRGFFRRASARLMASANGALDDFEMRHPAELGELRLMGVEHIDAGLVIGVGEFENAALALAEHHRVDDLQIGHKVGAMIEIV